RVLADDLGGLGEQGVGFGNAAKVRFLQRLVDQCLGAVERRIARAAARGGEEFGRLGIASGVVATIGLFQCLVWRQRSRLVAGEGGGIAEAGRRDRNFALDRLIDEQASQAQDKRAVVAGEPL